MINERATEIACLMEFLSKFRNSTVLDVGCHGNEYAHHVQETHLSTFDGIDVLPKSIEAPYYNWRFTGNFVNFVANVPHDVIISISAIEHAGITSYHRASPKMERDAIMYKIINEATKGFFITAPYGDFFHPNEFEAITVEDVAMYTAWAVSNNFTVKSRIFHRIGQDPNQMWVESLDKSWMPYSPSRGVESIVILEGSI